MSTVWAHVSVTFDLSPDGAFDFHTNGAVSLNQKLDGQNVIVSWGNNGWEVTPGVALIDPSTPINYWGYNPIPYTSDFYGLYYNLTATIDSFSLTQPADVQPVYGLLDRHYPSQYYPTPVYESYEQSFWTAVYFPESSSVVVSISSNVSTVTGPPSGTGAADFTVTLSQALPYDVTVAYQTKDGSAHAQEDYKATSSSLIIHAGSTSGLISVPIFAEKLFDPLDENFNVDITGVSATGGAAPNISTAEAQQTIHDGTVLTSNADWAGTGAAHAHASTFTGTYTYFAANESLLRLKDAEANASLVDSQINLHNDVSNLQTVGNGYVVAAGAALAGVLASPIIKALDDFRLIGAEVAQTYKLLKNITSFTVDIGKVLVKAIDNPHSLGTLEAAMNTALKALVVHLGDNLNLLEKNIPVIGTLKSFSELTTSFNAAVDAISDSVTKDAVETASWLSQKTILDKAVATTQTWLNTHTDTSEAVQIAGIVPDNGHVH